MKASHADFWVAATIVLIPAADLSYEHIDFHRGTTLEETAFFYDFNTDGASENSHSEACRHGTPAGGLGGPIDDDVVTRNLQPADPVEIPRSAPRMFVEECDNPAESGDTITPSHRSHLSSQRLFKTYAARYRPQGDTS